MTVHAESTLTPWADARRYAAEVARPVVPGRAGLEQAEGATLAEPLCARTALPGYEAAAMDGYAVAGPGPWHVEGRVLAGQQAAGEVLERGAAVEVATGAQVPRGTVAVLPYEESRRDDDLVAGEVTPGRHVRSRKEVCAAGEELLPAGAAVTPAVLGLAASVGHDELVVRRPAVTVLITGDELVDTGLPGPGHVRDAIGPLLPGIIRWAGGGPVRTSRVSDRRAALVDAIAGASADVVVCCGASSAGPADHLRAVVTELGADVWVDGVACRPGHPQLLGRFADGRVVAGLPGNPYAALAAAMTLLVPALTSGAGRSAGSPERARLVARDGSLPSRTAHGAGGGVGPHAHDTRLVAVRRDGHGGAVPVGHDRPGGLWGAALADALAVVPPGWDGTDVELLPLPGAAR